MQTNFNFEWDQYLQDDSENSEEIYANIEPVFDKSFSLKLK
jgi:hypothetical protein